MIKNRTMRHLSDEDIRLLEDETLSHDVVAFMLDKPIYMIRDYRHRKKFAKSLKYAQARHRAKVKQRNIEKFGKRNGCYKFWTQEEIDYLLASQEPDEVIAEKLGRTAHAIQKKRERELRKR